MPPLRRYLRITKYSVLETRIYLDNPADTQRWLLNPRAPVLPRVIEAVQPLVLPRLREEKQRARGGKGAGGKKKKQRAKDVVVRDDFEVAVFLTETSSRHSILRKEKRVKGEGGPRLGTAGGKMTGSRDAPVEVGEEGSGEYRVRMEDLPDAAEEREGRGGVVKEDNGEELFVSDGSENEELGARTRNRGKVVGGVDGDDDDDDKKKMAMDTTYDGFSIYGRILCLVVKRRGGVKGKEPAGGTGQAMMEEWIASTQMGDGSMMDE